MAVASIFALTVLTVPQVDPSDPATDWKQGLEYRIEARLDETSEVLEGAARVYYRNNSPHELGDFYLHLYLNAFRPNSAWARRDLEFGITTFGELGPEDHGFERILEMTADGRPVGLRYPFAPDSTIVGFDLPEPLEPGGTLTLEYRWRARTSTVARRQGRRGRQYDFAQWYPRVVVFENEGWRAHPLYRSGEFYGEFATYDVSMEVREDQVVGATGVPVEGDPGWETASVLGTGPVDYQREWYGSLSGPPCIVRAEERICGTFPARSLPTGESLGLLEDTSPSGMKQVRWYAEDVHHFAWSTSPDYVYEQGRWQDVSIHVLYQPGDEEEWGGGIVVRRTAVALEWLDGLFGDYPYPQVTNLHRIEGGGTEFPMVVMDGSASQGLIVHEVGHIYVHGILANNEWYEGWLDEGMSSFQSSWFNEQGGGGEDVWEGSILSTLQNDLEGVSEPVVLPAENYAEHAVYNAMIYTKGSVILWMLREMAGDDAMRKILRTYYERHRFQHVGSGDFQAVAEEVLRRDLDSFFGQWLHSTGVVDYALENVDVEQDGSTWITTFTLERVGQVVMPVPVRITGADGEARTTVWDGTDLRHRVATRTTYEPVRVELDPDGSILDWNVRNNAWTGGLFSMPGVDVGWDHPLRPVPTRWRDVPLQLLPIGWFNEVGGWVVGVQSRSLQLGLASRTLVRIGLPAVAVGDKGSDGGPTDFGSLYARIEAPVIGGRPRFGLEIETFQGEGRSFFELMWRKVSATPPITGREGGVRVFGRFFGVTDDTYLVPGRWSAGNRAATEFGLGREAAVGPVGFPIKVDGTASMGFDTDDRGWGRASITAEGRGEVGDGWEVRFRALAATSGARNGSTDTEAQPRERLYFLAGGDPLQTLSNPWARSDGAPLAEEAFTPGGGELRGFHPAVAVRHLFGANAELASQEWTTSTVIGDYRVRVVGFGGLALAGALPEGEDEDPDSPIAFTELDDGWHTFWSAGLGLEVGLPDSPMRVRFDVPLLISHPELATRSTDGTAGFRWTLSVLRG